MVMIKFASKVYNHYSYVDIVGLNEKKTLNLVCQMFMPVFEPTKILFAGNPNNSLIFLQARGMRHI
jgi:hypothetical protein